jgi:hypothetical protein
MKTLDLHSFSGWYVGMFKPHLILSKELEVGIKSISADTSPDYHYHKVKTEYTILLSGLIRLESTNSYVKPGAVIILYPYEKNDQYFVYDSLILILNTPSIQGDKFY